MLLRTTGPAAHGPVKNRPGFPHEARRRPMPHTSARASPPSALSPLPGPFSLPGLGSVSVLWSMITQKPFAKILADLRRDHGPIFLIKTGRVQQDIVCQVK